MSTFEEYGIIISSAIFGDEVSTQCPQCSSSRRKSKAKCLSVNVAKGVWHCNHCGWSGALRQTTLKPPPKRPDPRPSIALPHNALEWFGLRGITNEVLLRNRIDYGKVFMPQAEGNVEAVIFPYFRNGELINRKYRAIDNKQFRLESKCELILYGLDDIDPEKPLVWVEGEMDKLAMEVAGYKNTVSVPNGAPAINAKNYSALFNFLEADIQRIEKIKTHIIAVDADGPGTKLADELARRLGNEKCKKVNWPEGYKDANDLLMAHDTEELRWYVENAKPFPIDGVFGVMDRREELLKLYEHGFDRGYKTGWRSLDEFYTVRPGEFTVVTGVPGSGKSSWLDALLVNLARLHGWQFGIFSPENLPIEQHMAMIAEKYIAKPFYTGRTERMTLPEFDSSLSWVEDHFAWILPGKEDDWTVDKILTAADKLCLRTGIRGLVIDPWNELESLRPSQMSETEYISMSLKRIRSFARLRGVHVWIVVHPSKLYRTDSGKYPVPTLYDCMGSAHWRNKADNGIVVWRDLTGDDKPEIQIHVQKIRFRHVGRRGTAFLEYDPRCALYSEKPPEDRGYQIYDN